MWSKIGVIIIIVISSNFPTLYNFNFFGWENNSTRGVGSAKGKVTIEGKLRIITM